MATDSLSLRDGETGRFSVLYTYPGTYHYTLSQEKGTDKKTTYDETVYKVDVYVTEDEDGRMSAEPIIYLNGSNKKKPSAGFRNIKKLDTDKTIGNVKTGDRSNAAFWIAASGLSTMLMGIMVLRKKKQEDL